MKRTVSIGTQDFEKLRADNCFYIDKTDFIRQWWDSKDDVTLITRPRRFGKTLNMSMLNCFFSNRYENRGELFEGLSIWQDERFRKLQGTFPVIFLSFAGIKPSCYDVARKAINQQIADLYLSNIDLCQNKNSTDEDRAWFSKVNMEMGDAVAAVSLNKLCNWMQRCYGVKPLIFLDEYDTPLQEAYLGGYWDEMTSYIRNLFNNTFKTNPSLGRAIMTGITRVSKESIFSDLNNLTVVTTTSDRYAACFGFTEAEVFQALKEQGYGEDDQAKVKMWYDGFTFGNKTDIYNPWSVTNYLKEGKLDTYWANSSGNGLISNLLRRGENELKVQFEQLLVQGQIDVRLDEQIVFHSLDADPNAVWSLMLATGYLKVLSVQPLEDAAYNEYPLYSLAITNLETRRLFEKMISGWFEKGGGLTRFAKVLLQGDLRGVNRYLNEMILNSMSSFDGGMKPSEYKMPENFYHGLVLGLLVESSGEYEIKSNRESGYGRYDAVMEPKDPAKPAVIMEFKVLDAEDGESTLEDTAANALKQTEEKKYDTDLLSRGIPKENILKYGFAFQGKSCLIRKA